MKKFMTLALRTFFILASLTVASSYAIATDLLVGSFNTNEVIRYDATTGARIGVAASGGTLAGTTGITASPDGRLIVASFSTNQVLAYDADSGAALGVFASGSGLIGPSAVVYGPDGNLYVSSFETGQVLRYNGSSGDFIDVFASGGLKSPDGMAFGPDGNLYVCVSGSNNIFRFNGTTGALTDVFVPAGNGLSDPTGMTFGPDGDLYVSSFFTDSVLRYSGATGAFKGIFASGSGLSGPRGVSFGPDGNLYIVSSLSNQVLRYNGTNGAFIDVFVADPALNGPIYLAFVDTRSIQAVLPNHGGNSGQVTVRVIGSGFQAGAQVKLTGAGPDIIGTNTTVSNALLLTTTFDLTGTTPGARDVVIVNPNGTSTILKGGFTVQLGGAPNVWVDVIGRSKIRPGTQQTYYITYGNNGTTDAVGVPLTVSISNGPTINLNFPIAPPPTVVGQPQMDWTQFSPVVQTPTGQLVPLLLPIVPAGQSATLAIDVTVPSGTPLDSSFSISAEAGAPFFSSLSNPTLAFSGAANCVFDLIAVIKDALGVFLPATCTEHVLDTVQNIYFTFIQNTISPGNAADVVGSGSQLLGDIMLTLAQCAGTTVGITQLFQLVSTAYDVYHAFQSCAPIVKQLLQFQTATAVDPNDKSGSLGIESSRYVSGITPLRYAIFFSNEETATAPAQNVDIIDQLDLAKIDVSDLSFGPIVFGNQVLSPPLGNFTSTVDLRPANNLLIQISASLNSATGVIQWRFRSLDPATNQPPIDPSVGFLPPGGQGSVFFTAMPKQGLSTGTQIQNQATIIFDANAPLPTPTWLNTIDNDKPVSSVAPLAATQSLTSFTVQWSGTDVGSGIQGYTIFVSDNGGPFLPFVSNTAATSATFSGLNRHTYGFYSIARDLVGNVENAKTEAEATTQLVIDTTPPVTTASLSPGPNPNSWNNSNVIVNLNSTDSEPSGTGVKQIAYSATGAQNIASTIVAGSSASFTVSSEGTTTITFFGTDNAGNAEPAKTITVKIDKTPPTITGSRAPTPNANGWNNTDVTVTFICSDSLSGLAPGSPPAATLVSTEGANQSVTSTCMDLAGNSATATVQAINIDKTPPSISCNTSPGVLWPPNHKLVPINVSVAVSDSLSGPAGFTLNSVTSNEPDSGQGDIQGFVIGTASTNGQLRAERLGAGNGRVYAFTYTGIDRAGNSAMCNTNVSVPHDQTD